MSSNFFNLPNLLGHTMALELTQPLAEMNTGSLPGDKELFLLLFYYSYIVLASG
jgi:hypothetical protein